jgi:hypothetical protein
MEELMQKWEYRRYYWKYSNEDSSHGKNKSISEMMADFGENGWELVSVTPDITSYEWTNSHDQILGYRSDSVAEILFFKRPKE